ncbi:MAG: DegV family protein [Lachnospiraceae bacterium]|jgi:DegV family protein with EDD domain|nr:DegV family protein [Lachnospiraceae bacterium]
MKKVAVVTDSNSGITQSQGKELGIYVVPMPFMVDGETYYEDISMSQEEFYTKLLSGTDVITSQPSLDHLSQLWEEILCNYDEIIHIPMSSGLSSSCESATVLARGYSGRVEVANNLRISVVQRQSTLDAIKLAAAGKSALEIKTILEEDCFNCSIYIMLDTLYYLKKGGRITPAAAMLGSVLKIKPVLQIQGDKLDAFAKARSISQGKTLMLNAIKSDLQNRFGGATVENVRLHIAHTMNLEAALSLKQEMEVIYPGIPIYVDCLSLSVACHIGPGALAIACSRNLKVS